MHHIYNNDHDVWKGFLIDLDEIAANTDLYKSSCVIQCGLGHLELDIQKKTHNHRFHIKHY